MDITKCPHTQRKHYAKVRYRLYKSIIEHVFKLLPKIREEPERMELPTQRPPPLLDGHVPDLLSLRLPQGNNKVFI